VEPASQRERGTEAEWDTRQRMQQAVQAGIWSRDKRNANSEEVLQNQQALHRRGTGASLIYSSAGQSPLP
jgi:hypothetical protein